MRTATYDDVLLCLLLNLCCLDCRVFWRTFHGAMSSCLVLPGVYVLTRWYSSSKTRHCVSIRKQQDELRGPRWSSYDLNFRVKHVLGMWHFISTVEFLRRWWSKLCNIISLYASCSWLFSWSTHTYRTLGVSGPRESWWTSGGNAYKRVRTDNLSIGMRVIPQIDQENRLCRCGINIDLVALSDSYTHSLTLASCSRQFIPPLEH